MTDEPEDIIQEAIQPLKEPREASGEVDGTKVRLVKKSYVTRGQRTVWKVKVEAAHRPRKQKARLSHQEANELFEELVEKYDLEEKL